MTLIYPKGNTDELMVRKEVRKVTASQDWKDRMQAAKKELPEEIGQQLVIEKVIELKPEIDSLALSTRWRNAWFLKVSDPEFTLLVEEAVKYFKQKKAERMTRLKRQNLRKVK